MARGWESKSVESQQEAAEERQRARDEAAKSAEEISRERERDGLLLSRTRVLNDLEKVRDERRRESLRAALAYLDEKLAAL